MPIPLILRCWIAVPLLSTLIACDDTGSGPPEPATSPAGNERPAPEEVPSTPAAREPEPEPEPGRIREALGRANVAVVEDAGAIWMGRMEVTAALQAAERWLEEDDQIAGHPLTTDLVSMDLAAEPTRDLVEALLDEASYDFELMRRCRNEYYVGLRFTRGDDVVELALGMECHQAYFVYPTPTGPESVGAIMNPELARDIVAAAPTR